MMSQQQNVKNAKSKECFTTTIISHILDFACPNTQIILRHLVINSTFHDAIINYSPKIWMRILSTDNGVKFPSYRLPVPTKKNPNPKSSQSLDFLMKSMNLRALFVKLIQHGNKSPTTFVLLEKFLSIICQYEKEHNNTAQTFIDLNEIILHTQYSNYYSSIKNTFLSVFIDDFPRKSNGVETEKLVLLFLQAGANPWILEGQAIKSAGEQYMQLLNEESSGSAMSKSFSATNDNDDDEQQQHATKRKTASAIMFELLEKMFATKNTIKSKLKQKKTSLQPKKRDIKSQI